VGRVSAHIGEIGIRFAIPFMKPRRKMPLVASVGGFQIGLRPFQVRLKGISLHVAGVLGASAGEVDAKVACETEMDVEGKFPVKVGRINVDLCEAADLVE
jgi:hypothetical protein